MSKNYYEVLPYLQECEEVDGSDFYAELFPDNEVKGELCQDFTRPNAIYLYKDEQDEGSRRNLRRRVMLKDTWEEDYREYVEGNPMTLCSGLSYRGRSNKLSKAQRMHALIFDIDGVGGKEYREFLADFHEGELYEQTGKFNIYCLPRPTFTILSGSGLHLYYVFEQPIDLYPDIKPQLQKMKYNLTRYLWQYKHTSQNKVVQYQSINQGFRMVGSYNSKYDLRVRAFRTGGRWTIERLNRFVRGKEDQVNLEKRFKTSKVNREKAKELWPDWYNRTIAKKAPPEEDASENKWHIKKDLYRWWLSKAGNIENGHRYFYMMCLSIYAYKCDVHYKDLKKDMNYAFDELARRDTPENPLQEKDKINALKAYKRGYYNFTIDSVEKLCGVRIERNRRNYRTQKEHIKIMNLIRDNVSHPNGSWREGSGPKEKIEIVQRWQRANPAGTKTDCARDTGLSRTTVSKWWADSLSLTEAEQVRQWQQENPAGNKSQCARETGFSRNTVSKYWSAPAPDAEPDVTSAEWQQLLAEGDRRIREEQISFADIES